MVISVLFIAGVLPSKPDRSEHGTIEVKRRAGPQLPIKHCPCFSKKCWKIIGNPDISAILAAITNFKLQLLSKHLT
jgi:hypothetical protein